jgi:hypothetical protein
MTVTKQMLERMRGERRTPLATLEYTPDGTLYTQVLTDLDAQREKAIVRGEQTLRAALDRLRENRPLAIRQGLVKAQFNNSHEEQQQ